VTATCDDADARVLGGGMAALHALALTSMQTQVMTASESFSDVASESFSDVTSTQESVEDSCYALLMDLRETGSRIQRTSSKLEEYQAQASFFVKGHSEELADIMSTALQR